MTAPQAPESAVARIAGQVANGASRLAAALAAIAVLGCFVLVCWGVAARYFFNRPLNWADEVSGWFVVAIVMLAAADAQRRGENIGVDLLIERSSGRVRRGLLAFGAVTVAVCALAMAGYGVEMVQFSKMLDLRSNTLGWAPIWPVQVFVPLGAALLLVVSLAQLVILATGRTPDGLVAPDGDQAPKAGIE